MSEPELPRHVPYLYRYKTAPCMVPLCIDRDCWDYHSAKDRRRVPRFDGETGFNYAPDTCQNPLCNHPGCKLSHSPFEVAFHPLRYKTEPCTGIVTLGKCSESGAHCCKLHPGETARRPDATYPRKNADTSNELLFKMYQQHGALEAHLKRLNESIVRKKEAKRCGKCGVRNKTSVNWGCGHCACEECAVGECACGKGGEWLKRT